MITDPGDPFRMALLTALFDRMESIPGEKDRILEIASAHLERQREQKACSPRFQALWRDILDRPVSDMRHLLLASGPDAAELRHSHMFAGCLPPRELNRIRSSLRAQSCPSMPDTDLRLP